MSGTETILGAQEIRGLWHVYPLTGSALDAVGGVINDVKIVCKSRRIFITKFEIVSNQIAEVNVYATA